MNFTKIDLLIKKQYFKEALSLLEGDSFEVYERKAAIYMEVSQCNKALTLLMIQITLTKDERALGLIYAKIGKACFQTCQYTLSELYLNRAQQLLSKYLNTGEYAFTIAQLGNFYRFMFKDQEAEDAFELSLQIRTALFGVNSVECADSLHGLAQLYSDQGKLTEAIEAIEKAISIWTSEVGEVNLKTAKSIFLLGNLYMRLKQTEYNLRIAEEQINKALSINQAILGEYSQESADCFHSLGKLRQHQNQEFLSYFQKALLILESLYGMNHASIAIILNNLGRAYYEKKQFDDAVGCFQKAIVIYYQICGDHHGNLAITLKSCGDCHKEMKRYKQAVIDYEKAVLIYSKIDIQHTATVKQILGFIKDIRENQLED